MANTVGMTVRHTAFGTGQVVEQTGNRITIDFNGTVKRFPYPDIFAGQLAYEDAQAQEAVLQEIEAIQQRKAAAQAEEERLAAARERNAREAAASGARRTARPRRAPERLSVAFKCTYCDGGSDENGIGYRGICSDEIIRHNVEKEGHKWCCSENSYCRKYLAGEIDRQTLTEQMHGDKPVCYESQMLRTWTALAGWDLTGESRNTPRRLEYVQENSLAVLTTRMPNQPEDHRFIFAVFLVGEAYEGDDREEGFVTASPEYRLSLPLDQAQQMRFWRYYRNANATETIKWGTGLYRRLSEVQAAHILRDVAAMKQGTAEAEQAQAFYAHFCQICHFDPANLPENIGALAE